MHFEPEASSSYEALSTAPQSKAASPLTHRDLQYPHPVMESGTRSAFGFSHQPQTAGDVIEGRLCLKRTPIEHSPAEGAKA